MIDSSGATSPQRTLATLGRVKNPSVKMDVLPSEIKMLELPVNCTINPLLVLGKEASIPYFSNWGT
jgi:hypothetical protein